MSADSSSTVRLGNYRLDKLLGRGGMGEVFLAWDERLERHVAVKRILPDPPPDEKARARFRREARAVARLSHPAIVQVFDLLEMEDGDCLVMEYIEGQSLGELIAEGPLDLGTVLRLGAQVAAGLAAAHDKGLIHRDLKPENVRIAGPTGDSAGPDSAKILDFGLARLLWSEKRDGDSLETTITRTGALLGTVHAMSPEQASGRPVDHRSDLFAFGGLLYEMLTGRAPFRGTNVLDTLRRVTSEQPTPLVELRPGLPLELVQLVAGLLAKEPSQRPQHARLVADVLERLRTSSGNGAVDPEITAPPARLDTAPRPTVADAETPREDAPPAAAGDRLETVVRTLLLTDLVSSTRLVESLGDLHAAELSARHDRVARDLLARYGGLEIDKTDGFLLLFERPFSAVSYALAYHRSLVDLSAELGVEVSARAGLHLGEVVLRNNPPEDVARGAKPLEVEGLAKPMTARIMSLAGGRQTLLTQSVFDLTRRAAVDDARWDEDLRWLAHGGYMFKGVEEPVEVYEVGVKDFAPLMAPPDSEKVKRAVSVSAELMLGWRPALGQSIPRRPNWLLEERLGEGGFGEVWLAAHESGEKRVFKFCFEASRLRALKREVTLFRLLKEALGHRDDIARVLDWNFDAAPFFLEAEHTEGGDLTAWAEQQGGLAAVPMATRLELVAQVADALAAAHSVGVLHKDVKPENVLITHDIEGRPRVRLTDFGVGGLVDRSYLDSQELPALGFTQTLEEDASAAGSRRYMAPELLEGKPASVQADLYSLGVMLYQVVVGDFQRALASGWQRDVEDELMVEDIAFFVDGRPENRPQGVGEVVRRLRHLDARRERREAEHRAREQAEATRRALERAQRRRKRARWSTALVSVVLAIVSFFALQAMRARDQELRARQDAERRRGQAEHLIDFMLGDLRDKLRPVGQLAILREVDEEAMHYFAAVSKGNLSEEELSSYSQAMHQIGSVRFELGELPQATAAFHQSLGLARQLATRHPDNLSYLFQLSQSHFWVGFMLHRQRDLEGAFGHFRSYLEIARELTAADPSRDDWQLELAYAHSNLAPLYTKRGETDSALDELGHAARIMEKLRDAAPDDALLRTELAHVYSKKGSVLQTAGRPAEALEAHRQNLELTEQLYREQPEDVATLRFLTTAHHHLGVLLADLGQRRAALAHHQSGLELSRALAGRDPANTDWQYELGVDLLKVGRLETLRGASRQAEARLLACQRIFEDLLGKDSAHMMWRMHLALVQQEIAALRLREGQLEQAWESIRAALLIYRAAQSTKPEFLIYQGEALGLEGDILAARGDHRAARRSWSLAVEMISPIAQQTSDVRWLRAWARPLNALGQTGEGQRIAEQIAAMGYDAVDLFETGAQDEVP